MVTGDDGLWRRKDSPAWRSRRRSAPSRGKAAARVVGLCCGIGWTQEVHGGLNKASGILGRRAHRDPCGDCGAAVAAQGRKEEVVGCWVELAGFWAGV